MDGRIMPEPSPLLDAVFSILADGKPRTAKEIFDEGVKRGLFEPHRQTVNVIHGALYQHIERAIARGHKPLFVQDQDHRYRLNRTIDDWPSIDTTGLPALGIPAQPPGSAAAALSALQKASAGSDADAYERAVCAAFELFGFATTHVGGRAAPDGYADAPLGEAAYRVVLECKLANAQHIAQSYAVAEAANYREAYHGTYSALIAPSLSAEFAFISELRNHGVAAWTTDDLVHATRLQLDCSQMRDLFAPGYAAGLLDDLEWAQVHGPAKRLRVVASWLIEIGLEQQRMAHSLADGTPAPRLTADVALSTIDDRLTAAGSTHGVTRDEIDTAFTWLTSPYVDRAFWTDDNRTAIVVRPRV